MERNPRFARKIYEGCSKESEGNDEQSSDPSLVLDIEEGV
jgi:hypothetical protein